jgi:predicted ester cyclase
LKLSRFVLLIFTCAFGSCWSISHAATEQTSIHSAEQNRALIHQVLGLIDERKLDEAFELYALDYIYHGPDGKILEGREGIRGLWEVFLTGFPDLHSTIEDIVTEGDKLVLRWRIEGTHTGEFQGVAPTGAKVNLRVTEIFRIANGQLVEAWDQYDQLGLMQQIGAIPVPKETPPDN